MMLTISFLKKILPQQTDFFFFVSFKINMHIFIIIGDLGEIDYKLDFLIIED